jgi:hypothetical protein
MQNLLGKRILLIAPKFFGYEQDIADELRKQGAQVDFLPDRPFASPVLKALMRFCRALVLPFSNRHFVGALSRLGAKRYQLVFVIQGEGLSIQTLSILRTLQPEARFVWYMWDSLRNKKSLVPNLAWFDESYTFDPEDATRYCMTFRPLFFAPGFERKSESSPKYQISFIGTAHSDRYRVVCDVIAALPSATSCFWYLYLQAPWVFWAKKLTNRAFLNSSIDDFQFTSMSKHDVQRVFFQSFAILDIEHPRQKGLTMRTIETLGARKKLITTNSFVKDVDFYNPNNILVLDRDQSLKIPDSFFNSPYEPPSESVYAKYALKGWLRDVLSSIY